MSQAAASDAARDVFATVADELKAVGGERIEWWWRDDDAVADSPALQRLLALSAGLGLPVLLSVIPGPCEPALAEAVRDAPLVAVAQHGFAHVNHQPAGEGKKSEFGAARPADVVCAEIAAGRDRLNALFAGACLPVFVPPWNNLRRDMWPLLPGLAIRGLSAYGPRGAPEAAPGVVLANTHLDILDWGTSPARLADPERLVERLADMIARQRDGLWPGGEPIGILTHHRAMDAAAWEFVESLFGLLSGAGAVCRAPTEVFRLA